MDVSMLEGQMSLLNVMISDYLADGEIPAPMGTAYKALLPYQTFRTQTRDIALAHRPADQDFDVDPARLPAHRAS